MAQCAACGHPFNPEDSDAVEFTVYCGRECEVDAVIDDMLDDRDRDGGQLEDANTDAMDRWARAYDELNGAPENDEDR